MKKLFVILMVWVCSSCMKLDFTRYSKSIEELKAEFEKNRKQIAEIQETQNKILKNTYENIIENRANYRTISTDSLRKLWNARVGSRKND